MRQALRPDGRADGVFIQSGAAEPQLWSKNWPGSLSSWLTLRLCTFKDAQMAIIAVLEKNGRQEMVDVGRHIEHKDSEMAELALVVGDDWRVRRLGTIL